jgi:DNA-binding MarR family transcriptional regulator
LTRKHKFAEGQCDLNQIIGLESIHGLTGNQKKIISLINFGQCQANIAERMKFSRAYICTEIKKLESAGLIKTIPIYPKEPGKRQYTKFYELSPIAKSQIQKNAPEEWFTAARMHYIRMKFHIISQSNLVSLDKRAEYSKSWNMRGGARHKFWFRSKSGMPSVTLDIHPKTIVAYVDKKQRIPAHSSEEATQIGWRSLYQAIDKFIELQSRFNVQIDIDHVGIPLGNPHGGFDGKNVPVMEEGVTKPGWRVDKSTEAELGPGTFELESEDKKAITRLDKLIEVSEKVDIVALPEMFRGMIDPLNQNIVQVQAMMQGGITISAQYEQMLNFMTKVLSEMQEMRKENAELKAKLGLI